MDFKALVESIRDSRKATEHHRDNFRMDVAQYAGPRHTERSVADGGPPDREFNGNHTVNLLEMMIEVMTAKLISGRPACMASTTRSELKATARFFSMAVNRVAELINLKESLARAVFDSMFGMGIVKIGITADDEGMYGSDWHYSAVPFVDHVPFTDYIYDSMMKSWDLIRYEGNYFYEHIEDIRNDSRNDPEVAKALKPSSMGGYPGDPYDFSEGIDSTSSAFLKDNTCEMVRLASIYVVRERKIYTYCPGQADDKPLRVQDWVGPKGGPYRRLLYNIVPDNLMPLPPSQKVSPLADLVGRLWDKMGMQASRQKVLVAANVTTTGDRDAENIRMAADGEIIPVRDPNSVQEIRLGGVPQENLVMAGQARDMFNYLAGNIESIAGLGVSAPTASQEQLLSQSANSMVQAMQSKVIDFTRSVFKSVGWYVWNDPECRVRIMDRIAGTSRDITIDWPFRQDLMGNQYDDRDGKDLEDLGIDITPHSLQDVPPAQKAAAMTQVMTQEILPLMPLLAQQGLMVDLKSWFDLKREYTGMDFSDILKSSSPQEEPNPDLNVQKPPQTTRTYERVRGGGPSRAGADRAALMGMGRSKK